VGIDLTNAEREAFGNLETLWTGHAWPGANPDKLSPTEVIPTNFKEKAKYNARKKWSDSNPNLRDAQNQFKATIDKKETSAEMAKAEAIADLPAKTGTKPTLTAFGAMDFHATDETEAQQSDFKSTYYEKHWLPVVKRMTGESDPVSIIMQPFLWTGGHPMQVKKGAESVTDISETIAKAGGKATYGWQPPDAARDDAVIASQPPIPKDILEKAKSKAIHLVTAYYGAPVSDIAYPKLLQVLARVFMAVRDAKPVVIALLGDDEKEAHLQAAREIASAEVGVHEGPTTPATLTVQLAHIGRTQAMAQFERYSELFITEGANTWQEVLTMGTPALSVKPSGNTRPWEEGPTKGEAKRAADLVKATSEALIAAQNPDSAAQITVIADFIRDLRSDTSIVRQYFNEWSVLLSNHVSDQVITALRNLPELKPKS
jgi:hypothetical protein